MAYTHRVTQAIQVGGETINEDNTYSASSRVSLDETAPDSATTQFNVAIDVSAVKSFFLVSDQDVIFETNDASTPDDTINLAAGVPYIWNTDSYDTFLLGTDVTDVHITNASGSSARIQLEAIVDATP